MSEPKILKEEADYLILDKPAGLIVHPDGRTKESTLCDFILDKYPEVEGVGEPMILKKDNEEGTLIDRPGIVHRLDRDTSGVILVARTQKGFEYLKKQFKGHLVQKTYHAFVYGNIKEDVFVIDSPIGKSRKDFRQWSANSNARGKIRDAVTDFKVLQRSSNKETTLIEAKPKTGRTHQIRVHLHSIYHPIVADSLYAPARDTLLGFKRVALHAMNIEFIDLTGRNVSCDAEYPGDFKEAISVFE